MDDPETVWKVLAEEADLSWANENPLLVAWLQALWSIRSSRNWSFVTATTVGYGDFRPFGRGPRIIAILIALMGLTLTDILIAIAVHAGSLALQAHDAAASVK